MTGITRIHITDPFYENGRMKLSRTGEPIANRLYPEIMLGLQMPLQVGYSEIRCTREEAMGRYDWREGIDVILHCLDGSKFTLQEKFLSPNKYPKTITIEEYKASGKKGAWFYTTAQWYFTGYFNEEYTEFEHWIVVNLPDLRRARATNETSWFRQEPRNPRRGGPFLCFQFNDIPKRLIVAFSDDKI